MPSGSHGAQFQCPACAFTSLTTKGMGSHIRANHPKIPSDRASLYALRIVPSVVTPVAPSPPPPAAPAKNSYTSHPGSYPCPECDRVFKYPTALGNHRRSHGVKGESKTATYSRKKELESTTQLVSPNGKGQHHGATSAIERRSNEAAIEREAAARAEEERIRQACPDEIVVFAAGRITELCRSVAYEHDISPKLLAIRVAGHLHNQALRESSRRTH